MSQKIIWDAAQWNAAKERRALPCQLTCRPCSDRVYHRDTGMMLTSMLRTFGANCGTRPAKRKCGSQRK